MPCEKFYSFPRVRREPDLSTNYAQQGISRKKCGFGVQLQVSPALTNPNNHVPCHAPSKTCGEMKSKRHFCLIAAVALTVGCGEMDFDPQLSQAEEPPAYASRQAPTPVSPQAKPENTAAENPSGTLEAPPTQVIKPAPAPVSPNSEESPKDSVENLSTPDPAALPEIPETKPPAGEPKETKEDTLKLISDDPEKNLEVLNMALERWIAEKSVLPERLEQLVMEEYLPMLPMDPIGKRFAIDREKKIIILVRQ